MQKDRKGRDDSASREAGDAPRQNQTSAQSLQKGAERERKSAEALRSEPGEMGANEGSEQQPRAPRRSGSERASAGTPDLPRERPSAGTADIERGSGDPQESMVGDSTGAFKERP